MVTKISAELGYVKFNLKFGNGININKDVLMITPTELAVREVLKSLAINKILDNRSQTILLVDEDRIDQGSIEVSSADEVKHNFRCGDFTIYESEGIKYKTKDGIKVAVKNMGEMLKPRR